MSSSVGRGLPGLMSFTSCAAQAGIWGVEGGVVLGIGGSGFATRSPLIRRIVDVD